MESLVFKSLRHPFVAIVSLIAAVGFASSPHARAGIVVSTGDTGYSLWDAMTWHPQIFDTIAVVAAGGVTIANSDDFIRSTGYDGSPYVVGGLRLQAGGQLGSDNWGYFKSNAGGLYGWVQFDWDHDPANAPTVVSYAFQTNGSALSVHDAAAAVAAVPEPSTYAIGMAALLAGLVGLRRRKLRPR